jgi:hypothetical protein
MMNKIPDYLIDSICSQIKSIIDEGGADMMSKIEYEIESVKILNNGKVPKKVEILVDSVKPKKVIKETKPEDKLKYNFSKLRTLFEDGDFLEELTKEELINEIKNLANSYYNYMTKKVRGL